MRWVKKAHAAPLFAAALAVYPVYGQTPDGSASSGPGWRVECSSSGEALDCRALQQVVQRDNQKLVTAVAVRVPAATKKPVVVIQVPLGILVSAPVTQGVDDGAPERFGIQTCTQAGCFATGALPEAMIEAMRSGRSLKVAFQNLNRQTVTVTMPLTGFALAYEKIK